MAARSFNSLSGSPPEVPLSYLPGNTLVDQLQPEDSPTGDTGSAAQKRGRGRPPKPKPDLLQNGRFPTNLNNVPVPVVYVDAQPATRPRGRPRKDGTPVMSRAGSVAAVKERGRPRKSKPVSTLERVSPIVVNGSRKRGRPRRYDTGAAAVSAPIVIGEATAVVAPAKRRGRPPKMGGVISLSRTGKPRGRPRKDASPAVAAAEVPTGGAADYGALKRKYEFLQEKVIEATNKLKAAVSAMEEVRVIAAAMNTD